MKHCNGISLNNDGGRLNPTHARLTHRTYHKSLPQAFVRNRSLCCWVAGPAPIKRDQTVAKRKVSELSWYRTGRGLCCWISCHCSRACPRTMTTFVFWTNGIRELLLCRNLERVLSELSELFFIFLVTVIARFHDGAVNEMAGFIW